ncbi:hypothetical protein C7N43_05990 [Sphingobacteriales bacterium UPWRP_1]|nr:hypothetical protein BVG80_05760 [Sphingobacteriales bacterium TSM_CSM]PSJ78006.1 hypothetical protein C7N43_05990 [Sphingobacteriales bacterium UPWRP_1]
MKTIFTMPFAYTLLLLLLGSIGHSAIAQNDDFGWRIGAGIGYMSYYGDLTDNNVGKAFKNHYRFNNDRDLSFGAFIERRLTSGVSLQLSGNRGYISANDRHRSLTDPYFLRALNFRSEITDGNLSFIFKTDNDKMLSSKAILAPYFFAGAGLTNFKVFADLKDGDGSYYDYTIPILNDGTYETDITNIGTERIEKYNTLVPHVNAGIGLRLRLFGHFSINLQTDIKYAFSDYLDDVSSPGFRETYSNELQAFAGKPNPQYTGNRGKTDDLNDIYAVTSVSLRYNFGRKKEPFVSPVFYAEKYKNTGTESIQLVPSEVKVGNETVVVYDTIRVIEKGYTATYDSSGIGQSRALLDSLQQVKLSNLQIEAQMKQAQAEFTRLQQEMAAGQNQQDSAMLQKQEAMLSRMDSLQKSVTNLYIVSANADSTAAKQDSTKQAAYTDELKQLRNEINRLKAGQLAEKQPSLLPVSIPPSATTTAPQSAPGLLPQPSMPALLPVQMPQQTAPGAVAPDNSATYYKKIQTDIEALKTQISLLTAAVNAQTAAQQAQQQQQTYLPPVTQPQVAVQQPVQNPQLEATLQALNNQLYQLGNRVAALEQRPAGTTTTVVPQPQQPVIVNQPDAGANQALLSMVEDLRRQLQLLNAKVTELDKKASVPPPPPVPAPVPAPPTVPIPAPAPQPVNNIPAAATRPAVSAAYVAEVDKMGSVSIFFDVNSSVIKDSELSKIERVVDIIRRYPEARITINGYTDSTGSSEYNRKLSEKRAEAVKDRLLNGYRVNPAQVILNAFGNSNAMPGSSSYDRRVDLQWVK